MDTRMESRTVRIQANFLKTSVFETIRVKTEEPLNEISTLVKYLKLLCRDDI